MSQDPATPEEWQAAVNASHAFLHIHSCVLYGLMTGPAINAERCEDILARGLAMGIKPTMEPVDFILHYNTHARREAREARRKKRKK